MPTFRISCSWEVLGEVLIEADTFEKAFQKATETKDGLPMPSPSDSGYVYGSFKLDKQVSKHLNNIEE